ncbi:hypothetical protein L6164_037317 [Bauhinia variegata]|uniref:Uncharacterized protein n=1 Tax=Bauhinia variegata TaxID=167791 RepID=A0ACB9KJY2_BAUVA|nr:hypothetical protein L6164_037317 [Bauhinia variegata]
MVMKDQPMPKTIQGLLRLDSIIQSEEKSQFQEQLVEGFQQNSEDPLATNTEVTITNKLFTQDFEPRPSVTDYNNGIVAIEKKPFTKGFEPRPSVTNYNNSMVTMVKKLFTESFELKPSVTDYNNGIVTIEKRSFTKDFELRPSATDYNNGIVAIEKRSFMKDFEPRPSATDYNKGMVTIKVKSLFTKDFEPRPSVTAMVRLPWKISHYGKVAIDNKSFTKKFELKPSAIDYNDGMVSVVEKKIKKDCNNNVIVPKREKPSVNCNFKPRPGSTVYNE